ncbi:MAG: MucR family transcriptional regulator [Desulfobacteraceae bacterium]|nr:MucR family transcriptional regulator [Desulfobacteraceae bacterium]
MPTLIELTAQIVSAHAAGSQMTQEQLLEELQKVHASLKTLEHGGSPDVAVGEKPKLTLKQAFKKDEVICLICNKGFKTLKRHLAQAHDLKPGAYRKQFNIPSSQPLVAKSYSEIRRQDALDRELGDNLAKARAARKTKGQGQAAPVPVKRAKAELPMVKAQAPVPTVKVKSTVPVAVKETKPKSNEPKARSTKPAKKNHYQYIITIV